MRLGLLIRYKLLHEARLGFAISMCKSGPPTLWAIAAIEEGWLSSLRESKNWLHDQLKGRGPDRFGNVWSPDYWYEIRNRPDTFKRWIKMASNHAKLQHEVQTHWREWHHDFLQHIIENGYSLPFPWPMGKNVADSGDGCLLCHKTFRNRAAWAVHAFKVHGRVNDKRQLVFGTRCEACMREFISEDRLQRHLNYKTKCAVKLRHEGLVFPLQPGINSVGQRRPPAFPIPVMPAEGPQREWQPQLQQDWSNGILDDFEEEIFNCLLRMKPNIRFQEAVEEIKQLFGQSSHAFTDLQRTFEHFKCDIISVWNEHREDGEHVTTAFVEDLMMWISKKLHLRWFFSEEECATLPDGDALREAAWNYCSTMSEQDDHIQWRCDHPIPRFGHLQLVMIHLFAGEKREGDLQDALNSIPMPDKYSVVILAVDIIFDSVRGDLSNKKTQERWLSYIRRGFVLAMFAGPPCESWSRSRQQGGIPEFTYGDGGPRIIRSSERPLGLPALKPREVLQLKLANCLLLFALSAFFEMARIGRFAMLEHPSCPTDEGERWISSIWRLYVVKALQRHPWVQTAHIMQGHFGAASPKPTTLLFAMGQCFDVVEALRAGRTTQQLPKALAMGKTGKGGEFATASLKNYPSGLCGALSGVLHRWICCFVTDDAFDAVDQGGFAEFLQYVQNLQIHFNFVAQRGADFAR